MEEKTIRRFVVSYAWFFFIFGFFSVPLVAPLAGDGIGDLFRMKGGSWFPGSILVPLVLIALYIWTMWAVVHAKPNARYLGIASSIAVILIMCDAFAVFVSHDTFRGSTFTMVLSLLSLFTVMGAFGAYLFICYPIPPRPTAKPVAVSPWLGRVMAAYLVIAMIACILFITLPADQKGWAVVPMNFNRVPTAYVSALLWVMVGIPAAILSWFILLPLLLIPVAIGLWLKRAWGYWGLVGVSAIALVQSFMFVTMHVAGGYTVLSATIIPTFIISLILLPALLFTPLKHLLYVSNASIAPDLKVKL